jgi:hypothetical protein
MSAHVGGGLADDGSPMATACGPMKKSFGRLFRRAQREADVRSDLSAVELLAMISALSKPPPGARRPQSLPRRNPARTAAMDPATRRPAQQSRAVLQRGCVVAGDAGPAHRRGQRAQRVGSGGDARAVNGAPDRIPGREIEHGL